MTATLEPATEPRAGAPRLHLDVVPGVHRLEHAYTNCYIVTDGPDWTLVDAAFPNTWPMLTRAVDALGLRLSDLSAIVLTHGHFDHVGFARKAVEELGVRVLVHPGDRRLAAHPYRYQRERSPLLYPLLYPRAVPPVAAMLRAGMLTVKGVEATTELPGSGTVDVPGRPEVVYTPGHTFGHVGLHLRDRDALICGDALVTLDPYKGIPGAQIVAGAATADSRRALASLDAIAATNARVLLPGHGEPWRDGAEAAVAAARATGPS